MARLVILPLIIVAIALACSPSLEQCAEREVDALTPSELAACYKLGEDWEAQPTEELQQTARELLGRIPMPTPTPTPVPPTATVGFLEFQYHTTRRTAYPEEIVWFRVTNTSGVARAVGSIEWTAKDSNGNEYKVSPFDLFSIANASESLVTGEPARGQCWEPGGLFSPDPRIKPNADDCLVGFTWRLVEPETNITEVRYMDVRLPINQFQGFEIG